MGGEEAVHLGGPMREALVILGAAAGVIPLFHRAVPVDPGLLPPDMEGDAPRMILAGFGRVGRTPLRRNSGPVPGLTAHTETESRHAASENQV